MSAQLPRSPDEMLDSLIWRVTHSAYWLSSGVLLLFALVYLWRGQTLLLALEGVAVVGMTLGYLAGLRLRRAMLALDSIAVVNWLTLVLLAMMSGGLRSPAIVWLVVLPPMLMLAHPKLARALTRLHERPGQAWTLDAMAREAGMSRSAFAAEFKATLATTPAEYLLRWRVSLAQTMLRDGAPVKRVGDEMGYGSAAAFSRAFTQVVGASPRAWAKAG